MENENNVEKEPKEEGGTYEETAINAIKNQERIASFIKSIESGSSVLKASKAAGIDYSTIWRWRKKYKEFDEQILAIMDSRTQMVEDALFINAARGNLGAQIFWLKNRSGGRWKDKQEIEHTGKIDLNKEETNELIDLAERAIEQLKSNDKGSEKGN
jgi:transposase-like protein